MLKPMKKARKRKEMYLAVVGGVKPVEAEAEAPHGVYRHDEGIFALIFLPVRFYVRAHVPDLVFAHHAQKIGKHAYLLFCRSLHHIAQGGERTRRRHISEEAAVGAGILVQSDELTLVAALDALGLGAFVEGAESVIYELRARLGTAVEGAVESAVPAASHDDGVSLRRPVVRLFDDLFQRDVELLAETGKQFALVYPCGASAHSVDDYKTIFHIIRHY